MRSAKEVEDMLSEVMPEGADRPSRWPGMTYEQGVSDAMEWVLGWTDETPLSE